MPLMDTMGETREESDMDEVDRAQVEIEHALLDRMAAVRGRMEAQAVGACLNCGEPLPRGVRWCDAGCRDDWSRSLAFRMDD